MKFRHQLSSLTLVLAVFPSIATAQFFDLPQLVGPAPLYGQPGFDIEFDLGVQYTEIDNLLLVIEANITPLSFESCGTMNDPAPCKLETREVGFLAAHVGSQAPTSYALLDGFSSYEPRQAGIFQSYFAVTSFEDLLDGRGRIFFEWNVVGFIPEANIQNLSPPTGTITEAILIVEGTPVPEPAVLSQLVPGILALLLLRQHSLCQFHAV